MGGATPREWVRRLVGGRHGRLGSVPRGVRVIRVRVVGVGGGPVKTADEAKAFNLYPGPPRAEVIITTWLGPGVYI